MTQIFDCQSCGACCCNSAKNIKIQSRAYVEVDETSALLKSKPLLKQLAERREGAWFMKLVGDEQRCTALSGAIGERVGCDIYVLRPSGCRRVNPGDDECLDARRLHGLPLTRAR